jgi:hypothetical protein
VPSIYRVHKALWKPKNQHVALKTFHCPDLVPEELADFKRELWLTRYASVNDARLTAGVVY